MKLDHAAPSSTMTTARVVHDLGNLIQIASSAINVLARTPEMPAVHAAPVLRRARNSLDHAGALVRRTMGALRESTIASDCSDVATCLTDVAALLDSMCQPEIGITLDVEVGLPELRCDPAALHSAVFNLALNAREAIAGKGTIAIRGRTIANDNVAIGVEVSVSDDGVGMSAATIACAFDPFFTTKSDGLGGVGLPMVERFVRDASGEILIESEQGYGTTVVLRLPARVPVITPA